MLFIESAGFRRKLEFTGIICMLGGFALAIAFPPHAATIVVIGVFLAVLAGLTSHTSTNLEQSRTTLLPHGLSEELRQYGITLIKVDAEGTSHYRMPYHYHAVKGMMPNHNPGFIPEVTVHNGGADPQPVVYIRRTSDGSYYLERATDDA